MTPIKIEATLLYDINLTRLESLDQDWASGQFDITYSDGRQIHNLFLTKEVVQDLIKELSA